MAEEMEKSLRKGTLCLVAFCLAAIILSVPLLFPGPAGADAIKPPPVVLRGRGAPGNAAAVPFKPIRLVYRQSEGEGFRKPAGVFVDRETGEILVADSGSNLVTLLSPEGVPLFSFGYNGEVPQPAKAVLDRRGRILVLAGVPRKVKVFSYRGEPLGDFAFPGFEGAAQAIPTALTVDGAGNLYIADSTSGRILVYGPEGELLRTFGGRGPGPGGFASVTAIAVDGSGTIYVADARHEPAIQVFAPDGAYLRGWAEHSGGPQNVSLPSGLAVGPAGRVFVADTIRQTITAFTPEGRYLYRFGGLGTAPGALAFPSGLDADAVGRLYVAETSNARLQVFEPTGDATAVPTSPRQVPAAPQREQEQLRQGLGDMLKAIGK